MSDSQANNSPPPLDPLDEQSQQQQQVLITRHELTSALNEYGPVINENLAKRVQTQFKTDCMSTVKSLIAPKKLPENCKDLGVPKVNRAIRDMKSFTGFNKRNEKDLFSIQQSILCATSAIAKLADKALTANHNARVIDTKEVVRQSLDAITLLGNASSEISGKRKANLKYILSPHVRYICSSDREVSSQLLCDDLGKSLKEARKISRISTNFSNMKPYDRYNRSSSTWAKPSHRQKPKHQYFLEKGKRTQQASKNYYHNKKT